MFRKEKIKLTTISSLMLAALLTIVSSTIAADAQSNEPHWTGFYIGAYGGGSFAKSNAATSTASFATGYFATTSITAINAAGMREIKPSSFNGGGTAGFNGQHGRFVAGAEIDYGSMSGTETVTSSAAYPCCTTTNFTVTQSMTTHWLLTVRPRAGFTAGNAFVYGTAGIAATRVDYRASFTDTYGAARESGGVKQNKSGLTVGAGAEFKLGKHWSAKGEYLYTDFGTVTATSNNLVATPPSSSSRPEFIPGPSSVNYTSNVFTHSADLKTNNVRFGVNFHF